MLSQIELLDAIHKLAENGIPELLVIEEDAMPQHFLRPAWLTEYVTTMTRDAAAELRHVRQHFTITLYVEETAHGASPTRRLLELQEKALRLFLPGYLRVADRAVRVTASEGGRERDRAYVDIQLEYLDDWREPERFPLMEEVHNRIETNPQPEK